MNEEVEQAMNIVLNTIERWNEKKTFELAFALQLQMTVLELLVGCDRFAQLSEFTRILNEAVEFIDAKCRKENV